MRSWIGSLAVIAALASAVPAQGQSKKEAQPTTAKKPPSLEFATESLSTLTSRPTIAAARWHDVMQKRPIGVLRAIAAAERRGWRPTSTTLRGSRGRDGRASSIRPIAQELYAASSGGEMLVWDWNDGDDSTVEGTIYTRSYRTGNEMIFNVQIAGDVQDPQVTYHEEVFTAFSDPPPATVNYRGSSPIRSGIRLVQDQQKEFDSYDHWEKRGQMNACNKEWMDAGMGCMGRAAKERIRDGLQDAAIDAALMGTVGAAGGAIAGGPPASLAGFVGGVVSGAGWGFVSGVIESLIEGTDFDCKGEARGAYDTCASRYNYWGLGQGWGK